MSFDNVKLVVEQCQKNAESLLNAAKVARDAKSFAVAYHLGALSLEEIGKTVLVFGVASSTSDEDQLDVLHERAEDHAKKLFLALWSPTFGNAETSVQQMQEFQDIAREIHEIRLKSMYVDPVSGELLHIEPEQADAIIAMAESRLAQANGTTYAEPDTQSKEDYSWFQSALENPLLRTQFIYTPASEAKLIELRGKVKPWFRWMKEEHDKWQTANQELLRKELIRGEVEQDERTVPKWRMRITLRSDYHIIKPGPLNRWNQRIDKIKLLKGNKDTLIADFTINKHVPIQSLWHGGMDIVNRFVIALNVGTMGLFWWSFPTHVARYYDHIIDLENQGTVEVDCDPILKVNWGARRSIKEDDLNRCGMVLTYLFMIDSKGLEVIHHYMRAITAMVKTDIFLQIQTNALQMFYEALQSIMQYHSDWDGIGTFGITMDATIRDFIDKTPPVGHALGLAESLMASKNVKVNLNDVHALKVLCDFYIQKKAQEFVSRHRNAANSGL